jgi:hypothetical protein
MSVDFKILNEESLENIRNIAKESGYSVLFNLDKLVLEHDLKLITSPYDFDLNSTLLIPEATSWDKNFDKENALRVYESLPNLLPIHAADERLWTSLAFGHFFDYSKKRWGVEDTKSKDLSQLILNHWFCPTSRSRWRDHSISRLWWVGHIANSTPGLTSGEVLEVLYLNSELINSFLGHPRTTSSLRVGGELLSLLHEQYFKSKSATFNRISFRQLMHLIDLRAGKLHLDAISDSDLRKLLFSCFVESHKN